MPCYINLSLPRIDQVDFKNNNRQVYFQNFIYKVIDLGDFDLCNPFLFRISLLSSISIILGLVSSFIAYEAFFIKLLGNFLPFHNKLFLLVFIIGLHHLLNNVCFGGYIE